MSSIQKPSRLCWLGLGAAAVSSFLSVGIYGTAPAWASWTCLAIAVVCLLGSRLPLPSLGTALAGTVVCAAAAFLDPVRLQPTWLLLTAGFMLAAAAARLPRLQRLAHGVLAAGAVLLVQRVVLTGYQELTARVPRMPDSLAEVFAFLLRMAGSDAHAAEGEVAIFTMREVQPVAASWALAWDPTLVAFTVSGLVWLGFAPGPGRAGQVLRLLTLAIVWGVVRCTLTMAMLLHGVLRTAYDGEITVAHQLWSLGWNVLLMLPPVVIAGALLGRRRGAVPEVLAPTPQGGVVGEAHGMDSLEPAAATAAPVVPLAPVAKAAPSRREGSRARGLLAGFAVFAGVALVVLGCFWVPSGAQKQGRILIDEHHCRIDDWSKWRWRVKTFDTTSTVRAYDTDWYGHSSGYNYATLFEYCSRSFSMKRNLVPLSDAVLADIDVLVLKLPTHDYELEEVAAVERFVARGGGLLVIGEHTTVFGSGVCLNQIARKFGFSFRYDCVFNLDTDDPTTGKVFQQPFDPSPIPHPSIQRMGHLDLAVSCSVDPGLSPGRAVMLGSAVRNAHSDYFVSNFYPQPTEKAGQLFGSLVQLWATQSGSGRVMAFTDSTIFANFSVCDPGKLELFVGMLQWLNYKSGMPTGWLAALGLLLLGLGGVLGRRGGLTLGGWVFAGTVAWLVTGIFARYAHDAELPALEQDRPVVRIGFETALTKRAKLPTAGYVSGKPHEYGLFERGVQRLTRRMAENDEGETWISRRGVFENLRGTDVIVVLEPDQAVSENRLQSMKEWVQAGGRLLVLDSAANEASTANEILKPFGLGVRFEARRSGRAEPVGDLATPLLEDSLEVTGGDPLLRVDGAVVASCITVGNGQVTVLGCGDRFADAGMGITGDTVPDKELRRVFDLEYQLLRRLVDGSLVEK